MRLIDADALDSKLDALAKRYAEQKRFEVAKDYSFVQTVLLSAPTIDAVPVVHGRWEFGDDGKMHCCNCDKVPTNKILVGGHAILHIADVKQIMKYCPNCGAKMDGEEQSKETQLKTLRCVYAESAKENEIGEKIVWCGRNGGWMNVSLGDCYGQCESQAAEVDGDG